MTVEMKEKHREEHVAGKKKSLKRIIKRNERSQDEDTEDNEAGGKQSMMDKGKKKEGRREKKRPGRDEDEMDIRGDEDMKMEMDEHGDGKRGRAPKSTKSKRGSKVADVDENTPMDVLMDGPKYASPGDGH